MTKHSAFDTARITLDTFVKEGRIRTYMYSFTDNNQAVFYIRTMSGDTVQHRVIG